MIRYKLCIEILVRVRANMTDSLKELNYDMGRSLVVTRLRGLCMLGWEPWYSCYDVGNMTEIF
jgi:hypothetical protein